MLTYDILMILARAFWDAAAQPCSGQVALRGNFASDKKEMMSTTLGMSRCETKQLISKKNVTHFMSILASLIRKLYVHVCSIFLSKHLSLSLGIHEGELCIQGAQQQANVAGEVWMGLCDHHIAGLAIQSQKLMIRFP